MKFRTEIEPFTLGTDIDYRSRLLALGSCFAEHIAARLSRARFRIEANPTGILFNPASIVRTLDRLWHAEPVRREELHRSRGGCGSTTTSTARSRARRPTRPSTP